MEDTYPKMYLYRRIVQSKLYIDANYSCTLDLRKIADQAYFSKYHFIRLFRRIYGRTPHQYLTHVRIEKAKQLLREGFSVTRVCFEVGFDSVTSFTALFTRLAGQAPSLYRRGQSRLRSDSRCAPLKFIPGCFAFTHS